MKNYLLMKSKKIPTYLKYYLSKTRLNGLVFNKTYLENLSGTSFYLDHSIEDKIKINFKSSESTQESTPTPDYPQDVHVVKGDNEVVIENKNFINVEKTLQFTRSKTISANIKAGTYHITNKSATASDSSTSVTIKFNNNNVSYNLSTSQDRTITLSNNETTVYLFSKTDYPMSANISATIEELMISEKGGNYQEHKEQNYPLTLGNLEMCNINNYADEIFKNVPECEYYDDTLEVGKWYKYARIGKVVLDGSEDVTNFGDSTYEFRVSPVNTSIKNGGAVLCNKLQPSNANDMWNVRNTSGYNLICATTLNSFLVMINNQTTVDGIKSELSNGYLVYYILATPTKTLLSDTLQEQLENIYNNAHTYDKITNINQINEDRPFILDISYYRKVK